MSGLLRLSGLLSLGGDTETLANRAADVIEFLRKRQDENTIEIERLTKIETAVRALQFSAYPALGDLCRAAADEIERLQRWHRTRKCAACGDTKLDQIENEE